MKTCYRNWRKGNSCYKVAENLAELANYTHTYTCYITSPLTKGHIYGQGNATMGLNQCNSFISLTTTTMNYKKGV